MDILVSEELLTARLRPFQQVCPTILDVFIWRNDLYPLFISGGVTLLFGSLYFLQPSVITTVAVFALMFTLVDFLLPLVAKSTPDDWSDEKEKKFTVLVNRIVYYSILAWNSQITLQDWKAERPNLYSSCVITTLVLLAWIGNAVNNLFLFYLAVLFCSLLPGLLHRRILQTYLSQLVVIVGKWMGFKPNSKKKE